MSLTRSEVSATIAGVGAGALAALTLIPFTEEPRFPALGLDLLVALAGFGGLALTLAAWAATAGERHRVAARLEATALWGACGLAVLCAAAAVAASAESLQLGRIVVAQRNTLIYILRQPAAASVYLVAIALAGQAPAMRAVLGEPTRARAAAEAAVITALSALGATLFLGGFAGQVLPEPVWVIVKTLLVAVLLVVMRRRLAGLAPGPRLAMAWVAAMVGLLNLAITVVIAPR